MPSDEVDMYDTVGKVWTTTRLSHKVCCWLSFFACLVTVWFFCAQSASVSMAALGSLVFVTGGSTIQNEPPTFGRQIVGSFDFSSYSQLGVDRFDETTGDWTFVPNVLTRLVHDRFVPPRIAVTFAGRHSARLF